MENENKQSVGRLFNEELLEKARQANSPEELLALAKENGMELSEESAEAYFEQIHKSGEISDDELDNVAGGGCYSGGRLIVTIGYGCCHFVCKYCGHRLFTNDPSFGDAHYCSVFTMCYTECDTCKYCSYEKGLWLCNNPANFK